MVTTDKVYENREWSYGYRESDRLGGHDPYSTVKQVLIAIGSWRKSFCGTRTHQTPHWHSYCTAGNVIGGGDWSLIVLSLMQCAFWLVANRFQFVILWQLTWQHVIEPLAGYLKLAGGFSHGI